MEFQLSYFTSWKMMLWKCYTQYASKFGKLSSGHRTGRGQFSLLSLRKAIPKNAQTTTQLHSASAQIYFSEKNLPFTLDVVHVFAMILPPRPFSDPPHVPSGQLHLCSLGTILPLNTTHLITQTHGHPFVCNLTASTAQLSRTHKSIWEMKETVDTTLSDVLTLQMTKPRLRSFNWPVSWQ